MTQKYTDSQRRQVHESLGRLKFQDSMMQNYASANALSNDDVVDVLARARKLAQRTEHEDASNAADIVMTIKGYRTN